MTGDLINDIREARARCEVLPELRALLDRLHPGLADEVASMIGSPTAQRILALAVIFYRAEKGLTIADARLARTIARFEKPAAAIGIDAATLRREIQKPSKGVIREMRRVATIRTTCPKIRTGSPKNPTLP